MSKIVLFAPKYPPETGGASVYFKQVVQLLEDTEYNISVFAPKHEGKPLDEIEHGATIYRVFPPVGAKFYAGLKHIQGFNSLLKKIDPDIAHVHPHFPQYRWFRFLLKSHHIPRIYDCRDKDFSRRYVKDGSFYLSATKDIDSILIDEIGVDPTTIARSPVTMPSFGVEPMGLDGENHVAFVGELTKHKGLEKTVYAVARFLSERNVSLHVAGDGPLREWIANLDIDTSWLTYYGELDHSESLGLIESSDVVCLPSIREGRPRVALEAIEMDTPIVGSNAGDIPEVVGDAGLVVDRTIVDIGEGIETVLDNSRFEENAREREVAGTSAEVREGITRAYEAVKSN